MGFSINKEATLLSGAAISCLSDTVTCEQALHGAAVDLYGSCGGGSGRKGPVGMDCIFEFDIPDLRYMACFVIFP